MLNTEEEEEGGRKESNERSELGRTNRSAGGWANGNERTGSQNPARCKVVQRRPPIRAMVNRSTLLFVQNLVSTERIGLSSSKIPLLIVQKALIIVQF